MVYWFFSARYRKSWSFTSPTPQNTTVGVGVTTLSAGGTPGSGMGAASAPPNVQWETISWNRPSTISRRFCCQPLS